MAGGPIFSLSAGGKKSEPASTQQESCRIQQSTARKSRKEIERYGKRQVDLIKESGLYGDCDHVVNDPRTDPASH
jgi:hypothetical protein